MKTIDNLIEKYKVQVLPQGAEDWAVICTEVAKEYAIAVVDEIMEGDYAGAIQEGDDEFPSVIWSDDKVDTLIEQIERQ